MPCFRPMLGWRGRHKNPDTGKYPIVFNKKYASQPDDPLELPCGGCLGCRMMKSRDWAIRCAHEAEMHQENAFLTLTFNEDQLQFRDNPLSICKRDLQLFMKRLRKKYSDKKIRFYACGEYGEKLLRPHYHVLLFGHDFTDKYHFQTRRGNKYYRSAELEEIWPYGFSTIGEVTYESAAYVARYIHKKIGGDMAEGHYEYVDEVTGEILKREPEFALMSLKPGIGKTWLDKYSSDVYPHDFVVIDGKRQKPPKFYDRHYEKDNPFDFEWLKDQRLIKSSEHVEDMTTERLRVREKVLKQRTKVLRRIVEED